MKPFEEIKSKVCQQMKAFEGLDKTKIKDLLEQATQVGVQEILKLRETVKNKVGDNPKFQEQTHKWLQEGVRIRERAEAWLLEAQKIIKKTVDAERSKRSGRS
jgi:hypothetical protein